ncbi:MAG: sodium:solute symporter family protein [Pirellulales bacterium]|nr:sodium:solute symporter family protein [Pirellulales bacterium]
MSNFSILDGSIVGIYLIGCMVAGIMARRYVSRVDQFLVAGREMNLYLGIASLAATEFGIATCMYSAELGFKYGFSGATPGVMMCLSMLFVGYTGFCIKPLRDAGVITVPEFFQTQFGSKVRWMSGLVIVLGGLLNMGVFLRVGGEFLIAVCGFNPDHLEIMMTVLLLGVAAYTILGGMVSILITDYLQFIVMSIGLIAVTILVFCNVGWNNMVSAIETRHGPGGFNPFIHDELGWQYVVFYGTLATSGVITWQTIVQRVLAAKDSKTGQAIYRGTSFFFVCRYLIPGLWGIAALAALDSELVSQLLVDPTNARLAMPTFLRDFLPVGMMGIVIAAMLAADMSSDSAYMLSWGSVIYNDILAPFHKNKWSQKRGLLWNRMIVASIGVFLLLYGLWYPLKDNIMDYLAITGSIYLSSMSVLLIAGCYWRRSNNWGAAAAICVGAIMPVSYLVADVLTQFETVNQFATRDIGLYLWGILTYIAAAAAMVIGSLLKISLGFENESEASDV